MERVATKEVIANFKDLRVWQDAMTLSELVYNICASLPKDEVYGLSSQMKRAAVSVAANIAEGSQRNNTKELIQFLYIAKSSLAELETLLLFAQRVQLVTKLNESLLDLIDKQHRGLMNLIKSLRIND